MFVNAYQEKAQQLLDEQKLDEALVQFNLAVEANPESAEIYNQRAVVYIHLNKKYLSLEDFNKAVELDPEYAYRYASRAYGRDFFGDTDGAIEDYKIALELEPDDAVANNNLGVLLEKKGYQDTAANHYKKADMIAKIEEQFNETMLEKEGVGLDGKRPMPEGEKLQPKKLDHDTIEESSKKDIYKEVFTKKSTFKEFIQFVKNGFKLKNDDDIKG